MAGSLACATDRLSPGGGGTAAWLDLCCGSGRALIQAARRVQRAGLAGQVRTALTMPVEAALTQKISDAGTIYFAGGNDGVAAELTLKTSPLPPSMSRNASPNSAQAYSAYTDWSG